MENKPSAGKTYVGLLKSSAVRDAQACRTAAHDPLEDDTWYDVADAELYLGIYRGDYKTCLAAAAEYAMTDPSNIKLVEVEA